MENTQVGQTSSNGTVQISTEMAQKEKIATAVADSRAFQQKSMDSITGVVMSGIQVIMVIVVIGLGIRLFCDFLSRKK